MRVPAPSAVVYPHHGKRHDAPHPLKAQTLLHGVTNHYGGKFQYYFFTVSATAISGK